MTEHGPDRRAFLRGALGAGVGGAMSGVLTAAAVPQTTAEPVPFHGRRQAGVLAPTARHAVFASFDVVAGDQAELATLLRTITARARFLVQGDAASPGGPTGIGDDSGVLGPEIPGHGLTVTLGVGASLFDARYGLAERRPVHLTAMPAFPNDALDPAWCHGDLLLQLTAPDLDTVLHGLRDIAGHTRDAMHLRWRMTGFTNPPRPAGTPRNLLGFKDGTANPDERDDALMERLVWTVPDAEPSWTAGGTYVVVRLIRMLVEFWDTVSIPEQENIFGRRKDTGAPLSGGEEHDEPRYADDPMGFATPLTSHIRRANPRTPATEDSRILRRAYNYDLGVDQVGELDMGLIFTCFQQDIPRQFEAVQHRLTDEPLIEYISPFGGGYFFVLPGVTDQTDHFGRSLLT